MIKRMLGLVLLPILLGACQLRTQDESKDRAEIHALLTAYGSTIDARDFDGFARLFAKDGVYVTGDKAAGGKQAGENMRQVFAKNANGFREPNFHMFFNEVITLDDIDHAHATSMSFWVVPGADDRPTPAMAARYEDKLVREDGVWKFASRKIVGLKPPAPVPPKK